MFQWSQAKGGWLAGKGPGEGEGERSKSVTSDLSKKRAVVNVIPSSSSVVVIIRHHHIFSSGRPPSLLGRFAFLVIISPNSVVQMINQLWSYCLLFYRIK